MKRTELERRTPLGAGAKSAARGSTFASRGDGLKRTSSPKRTGFTPASDMQRRHVAGRVSIVSGEGPCDPAHLTRRSDGGCDDPLCVVPLTREEHRAFDDGRLDLLPYLIAQRMGAHVAHAVEHANGDVLSVAQRLTGVRWTPEREDTDGDG